MPAIAIVTSPVPLDSSRKFRLHQKALALLEARAAAAAAKSEADALADDVKAVVGSGFAETWDDVRLVVCGGAPQDDAFDLDAAMADALALALDGDRRILDWLKARFKPRGPSAVQVRVSVPKGGPW
jgi:hypothetical protein